MRIRKRQALFSSSSESLTPLHLSDPNLIIRSPVVVQLGDDTHAHTVPKHVSPASSLDRYQPSDQTLPLIGKLNNGCDYPSGIEESGTHKQHNKLDPLDEKVREEEKESGESRENKSNHISKGDILVVSQVLPSSSTTFAQDGRWCEGEKAIPLKKRRGRFENDKILESNNDSKKVMKGKMMKTKMNKKCSTVKDEEDEEESGSKNKKRMRKRGSAVVMEGSRCSRVNGRGWRCCQQTLVGYSLCEHHLGKGRLRSMTSVRNRSIGIGFSTTTTAPSLTKNNINASSSNSDVVEKRMMNCAGNDDDKTDNFDEKKQKKRVKLGMVKARSISSLLGQPDNKVAPVGDENNK